MSTISQVLDTLFKSVHIQDLNAVIKFLGAVIHFTRIDEYTQNTPRFGVLQKSHELSDYDIFLAVKVGHSLENSGLFLIKEHFSQTFIEIHLDRTIELLNQTSRRLRLGKFEVLGNELRIPDDYPLWQITTHLRRILEQRRSLFELTKVVYSPNLGLYVEGSDLKYKIAGERKRILETIITNTQNNQPTNKNDLFELGSSFDFGDAIKSINEECRRIFSFKPKVIKFSRSSGGYFINTNDISVEIRG